MTALISFATFTVLLSVARQVHVDIPYALAVKLPLLRSQPELIFAGESRTEYQVDPALAAEILGKPNEVAVNIAYDAGEPMAVLAAAHQYPEVFRKAHVVVSVAPFIFNEGVQSAAVYPLDVVAQLSINEQLTTFLPLRIGTLFRFIREAFRARLAFDQQLATQGPAPPALGLSTIPTRQSDDRWPADLGTHAYYARWNLAGPKARVETAALCELASKARKLTVVAPPWAPRYSRDADKIWQEKDDQYVALLENAGKRCGFEVLKIPTVPGIRESDYADEMHILASAVPKYTGYLIESLSP
ncbi:hypothetical protein [Bradyrhizobium erythrophlei]|uniref:hypothetical protein n=1 Tax=Bradyrhizobium erythrophlei TaxID=1437360 RepID=UPI0012EBFD49|nr:hypothetical protein [Bradyrhizobium erythrophlei]